MTAPRALDICILYYYSFPADNLFQYIEIKLFALIFHFSYLQYPSMIRNIISL